MANIVSNRLSCAGRHLRISISLTYFSHKGSLTKPLSKTYHLRVLNKEVSMRQIFALVLIMMTSNSWGWGSQGHMVVGQIGQNNLTPNAKKAVQAILKGQTLADVANWADYVKSKPEWAHTKSWHFVDIEDGQDYSTAEHKAEGDVVGAITDMVKVLKTPGSSDLEKENALKFIVHFVGDIHQPLHVGKPEDRGGNDVRITFGGKSSNLHALWDSLMIMKSPMDHIQYANWLEHGKAFTPPYDLPAFAFSTIISEDMNARSEIYNFSPGSQGNIQVTEAYYKRNVDLMNRQLLSGGKRLATLLNSLFR